MLIFIIHRINAHRSLLKVSSLSHATILHTLLLVAADAGQWSSSNIMKAKRAFGELIIDSESPGDNETPLHSHSFLLLLSGLNQCYWPRRHLRRKTAAVNLCGLE